MKAAVFFVSLVCLSARPSLSFVPQIDVNTPRTSSSILKSSVTPNSRSNSKSKTKPLPEIVIPSIFDPSSFSSPYLNHDKQEEEDPRVWVPQTDSLSFRPLCLCTSQGYYVNLLKFRGGGILGRHRHPNPVHALTLRGSWGYDEHPSWHAHAGTYVFEPPGETHTLRVDEDCEEMVALFHVTGTLIYTEKKKDGVEDIVGYDDVFTKIEKAKKWYGKCGLGEDYVDQFVR